MNERHEHLIALAPERTVPNMKSSPQLLKTSLAALPAAGLALALVLGGCVHETRVARGQYLATAIACADCHTPKIKGPKGPEPDQTRWMAGHAEDVQLPPPPKLAASPWNVVEADVTAWAGLWGVSYSANLTPDINTGLGIWTEDMFIQAMRTGKHMGSGRDILPPMPWNYFANLTDDDLKAIFAYLRSLPPVSNRVPDPVPPGGAPGFE